MRPLILSVSLAVTIGAPGLGCKRRVTPAQCEELLSRYAELVVRERAPDASAATVEAERKRERAEATHDDAFRNCPTEVQPHEYRCAMAAETADALEKCLE